MDQIQAELRQIDEKLHLIGVGVGGFREKKIISLQNRRAILMEKAATLRACRHDD